MRERDETNSLSWNQTGDIFIHFGSSSTSVPVCDINGDLLAEMDYDICNYAFISA